MDKFKVDHNKIDDLSENMSQVFEATSQAYNLQKNVALSKGAMTNDYDAWKEQMKGEKAKLKASFDKSNNQVSNIVKSATQETMKEAKKSDLQIKNELKKPTTNLIKEEGKAIKLFEKAVLKDFDEKVSKIYKLRNQEPLFDAIAKYTNEGGIANAPKITYANGRTISFKAYMEMNVRTTIRQEVNETLFEASKNNGVVFYLGNSFSDCAKDHLDYDGKMFYDRDWQSFGYDEKISEEIQAYIDANNLMTYQYATEQGFTTRPNCRHSLTPMTIDEVLGNSVNQLLKDNNLNAKSPRNDTNYLITQNQRYFERQIRQAKMSLEAHSLQQQNMPTTKMNELITRDKEKIAHYQKELRILMDQYGEKNGGFLKRDYRRENPAVVVQDAGVRYTMGIRGVSASKVSELIENKQVMEIKQEPVKEKYTYEAVEDLLNKKFKNSNETTKNLVSKTLKTSNKNFQNVMGKYLEENESLGITIAPISGNTAGVCYGYNTIRTCNDQNTLRHELGHSFDNFYGKDMEGSITMKYVDEIEKKTMNEVMHEELGMHPYKLKGVDFRKGFIYSKERDNTKEKAEKVSNIVKSYNEYGDKLFDKITGVKESYKIYNELNISSRKAREEAKNYARAEIQNFEPQKKMEFLRQEEERIIQEVLKESSSYSIVWDEVPEVRKIREEKSKLFKTIWSETERIENEKFKELFGEQNAIKLDYFKSSYKKIDYRGIGYIIGDIKDYSNVGSYTQYNIVGHGQNYFKDRKENGMVKELFANLFDAYFDENNNEEKMLALKEMMPRTIGVFERIIKKFGENK